MRGGYRQPVDDRNAGYCLIQGTGSRENQVDERQDGGILPADKLTLALEGQSGVSRWVMVSECSHCPSSASPPSRSLNPIAGKEDFARHDDRRRILEKRMKGHALRCLCTER